MKCTCKPKMIVPIAESVAVPFWGYIHSKDKQWHVRRWIPVNPYMFQCDLCVVKEDYVLQKEDPLILYMYEWPIYAINNNEACSILEALRTGVLDEFTWFQDKKPNRFIDLLNELDTI